MSDTMVLAKELEKIILESKPELIETDPDREKKFHQVLADLKGMTSFERETKRKEMSEKYNVRQSFIDKCIANIEREKDDADTNKIVKDIEPAADPVNGADLLDEIMDKVASFVFLPEGTAAPIALWVMLTYCHIAFRILPLLGIVSPVKRCGKTTLLEFLSGVVSKGLSASNISPAAVYRTVEKYCPALLIDEADTFLKDNDELRGIVNSGHIRSTAYVIRVEGDGYEPVRFSTWGPKAIAMIGYLPETIGDRSIVIRLRRKTTAEKVNRIGLDFDARCVGIRSRCRRWADDHIDQLKETNPNVPDVGNDRAIDNWSPLFSIADVVGGDWPGLVETAMKTLHDHTDEDESVRPMLLADIQEVFDEKITDRIFSNDLVTELIGKGDRPWPDWNRGQGLTQNGLARLLKPFGIKSKQIRIGSEKKRGYSLDHFKESFDRYVIKDSISGDTTFSTGTRGTNE